ncbi:MAG: hypothetical protein LBH98_06020 [Chitinispirillales bacterium]|nr:hypothetical protein [Chitinispirillales bacterium]
MRIITIIVIIAILWVGIYLSSIPLSAEKSKDFWVKERATAVISSPEIIPYLLGFETVFADYLWIKTILYTGENMTGDNNGEWLRSMIEAVNMLNPPFYPSYEFAALMLPNITDDWEASRLILENGIPHVSGSKERFMYFYLGWIYYTRYRDYERAADLFAYSAKYSQSPAHWARLSATALSNAGKTRQAIEFLQDLYESSDDPQVRKKLLEKINLLYEENRNGLSFQKSNDFLQEDK